MIARRTGQPAPSSRSRHPPAHAVVADTDGWVHGADRVSKDKATHRRQKTGDEFGERLGVELNATIWRKGERLLPLEAHGSTLRVVLRTQYERMKTKCVQSWGFLAADKHSGSLPRPARFPPRERTKTVLPIEGIKL